MSKIIRYDGDVKPFGVNATGTERTVFGSPSAAPVQSDTLDANINADYLLGWEKIAPGAKPPKQYFNGALFTATQLNAYLHQIGIAEWNGGQEYQVDSFTNRSGILYRCKTVDHTSVTPPESDAVNWELGINAASETVAGIAEVATQAETDTGADDTRFITPKKLLSGFSKSLLTSGYVALPSWLGGVIFQWGTGTANGADLTTETVVFPVAFPVECVYAGALHKGGAQTVNVIVNLVSTTSAQFESSNVSPVSVLWFAVGY